jgi:hypothetical protein
MAGEHGGQMAAMLRWLFSRKKSSRHHSHSACDRCQSRSAVIRRASHMVYYPALVLVRRHVGTEITAG